MKADPWAAPPTPEEAGRRASQPGMLSKALTWALDPRESAGNRAVANQTTPPLGLTKDSGDTMTALHAAVSGIPGYNAWGESDEARDRMQRFGSEHPWARFLLPLAGGMAKPAMLPVERAPVQPVRGAISGALNEVANKAGRRVLYGGANGLSEKFPVPDSSIEAAHRAGAFKPMGTTEHAANVLSDALDEAGMIKGAVIKEMEAAGIQGPDAGSIAQVLRGKAAWFRRNSAGTRIPDLYEKIADDVEGAAKGRLGVGQAENIKRSLQDAARYGDPNEKMLNIERRHIASVMRQGVEDASAADAATIGTPQLQDIRAKLASLRGASTPAQPHGVEATLENAFSGAADAATDARAAAMTEAAQAANEKLIPAKQAYALLAPAAKAAEKGLSQATKRNAFSLRDTIIAAPMAAAHGAGAGGAAAILTKALRTYGPSTVAWAAKRGSVAAENAGPAADAIARILLSRGMTPRPPQLDEILAALRQDRSAQTP